jgi:TonB-dependent receptor
MKSLYFVLRIIILFLFVGTYAYGQGTIRGVVTDSTTNEELVGANVILLGTSLGGATDLEGEYRILKVPEGNYRMKVSYVGYLPKEFNITVVNNKTLEFNVVLRPDIIEGEEVVVTGQAVGQAAAINQQLASNTIVNVVSEQKIKELPDANAAESIGRLPGVSILRSGGEANKVILRGLSDRYTTVTIDGVQIAPTDASSRGLDLSTISQSSLAGIELYKALTPDKDADAIAGSINLVTKKAPSLRELTVDLKGNYNDIMQSFKQYDFSFKYGERFFDDFLGVQLHGNLENKIRSNERINLDYDQSINNQTDYEINDFLLDFTDEIRKRDGFGVLLDINTPDNGTIKFSNVFNSTKRDYIDHNRDYPSGGGTGGAVTYSFQDIEREISTFNSSLTGDNNLFDFAVNWGLSFAQSISETPYDYYIDFLEASNSGISGMKNTPHIKSNPEQLIPFAYNNFKAATLYSAIFRTNKNFDKEKTAFLNLSREYVLTNNISGTVKFGGKYKTVKRSYVNSYAYSPYYLGYWQPYQRNSDGSITAKDLSNTEFASFFQRYNQNPINKALSFSEILDADPKSRDIYDLYKLFPLINRDKMREWYDINKNGISQNGKTLEYNSDPTVDANFYDITESITSGYVMNTLNIGQSIIFIAGLRVENEDNFYKSKYSPQQIGGFPVPIGVVYDTTATHQETIWLPNFHLNIKATDFLNIRLAVYKALSRPDFNMRLNNYFAWRPAAASSTKQLFVGNPLLKTAQAWNYEINTSFYGNKIGLISLSAFYKEIDNMYHMLNGINTSGNVLLEHLGLQWKTLHDGTYALTVPYNSPKPSKVWGFEFEHQINFTFLPGLLKNFVLSYNASIVRSETHLISSAIDTIKYYVPGIPFPFYKYEERPIETKQQLENQPEFYGNISLGYDIGGFSARISLFHQSEYNLSFTPSGRGDQIVNAFTRLDLALKQEVTDYLSLMLNIGNLTNIKEENSIYNRVNGYKILNTSERYGLTADFGVKLTL